MLFVVLAGKGKLIKVVEIRFDFKSVFSDLTVKNFLVISKFKEKVGRRRESNFFSKVYLKKWKFSKNILYKYVLGSVLSVL